MLILKNKTQNKIVSTKTKIAESFCSRLLGLMFRKDMDQEEALVFYKASSIHMFFMLISIDVLFLDKEMKVIKVVSGLKPWFVANCFGAYCTIELPAGRINGLVELGDELVLVP